MSPQVLPAFNVRFQGKVSGDLRELKRLTLSVLESAAESLALDPANEISVLVCDGPVMRRLNRRWRRIDRSTNVLSFPLQELTPRRKPSPEPLGDIVISIPVVRREARELDMSFDYRFSHMLIHGLLHLLGHDHKTDAQARVMERLEDQLLAQLGSHD